MGGSPLATAAGQCCAVSTLISARGLCGWALSRTLSRDGAAKSVPRLCRGPVRQTRSSDWNQAVTEMKLGGEGLGEAPAQDTLPCPTRGDLSGTDLRPEPPGQSGGAGGRLEGVWTAQPPCRAAGERGPGMGVGTVASGSLGCVPGPQAAQSLYKMEPRCPLPWTGNQVWIPVTPVQGEH